LADCNLTPILQVMEQLLLYDKRLFRLINYYGHNSFFDWLMPWLRNSAMWVPLYLFLLIFAVINYKKTGWWWIVFFAGTVLLTDFVSSKIIKENILRLRPCNDPSIASWVRVLVGYRPGSSSFTSSHAANHFSIFFMGLQHIFCAGVCGGALSVRCNLRGYNWNTYRIFVRKIV
jgi:hypothetical protein